MKSKYEDSAADKREDVRAAAKAKKTPAQFEKSAAEKRLDAAGQRRMTGGGRWKK